MSDELSLWFDEFSKKNGASLLLEDDGLVLVPTEYGSYLTPASDWIISKDVCLDCEEARKQGLVVPPLPPHLEGHVFRCVLVEPMKRPDGSSVFAPPEAVGM